MRFFLFLLVFFLASFHVLLAQQIPAWTHFMHLPTQLNPAFTGQTPHYRLTATYQQRWLRFPVAEEQFVFSGDYNWVNYNLGLGLVAQRYTVGGWQQHEVAFLGAYHAQLNRKWTLSLGLRGSLRQASMQAGDWIFEDALRSGGTTQESVPAENGFWGDFGTGALLFSEHFWIGASAQQLLRPRWPFTWATEADRLPRYWAVQGGGRFRVGSEGLVLAPSLQVRHQAPSTAADISLEAQFSPLFVGAVYRGLPLLQDEANAAYQDAAGLLAGVQYEAWKISLSYDLVLDGPVQGGGNVELILSFRPPQDRRRPASWRHVRCPVY